MGHRAAIGPMDGAWTPSIKRKRRRSAATVNATALDENVARQLAVVDFSKWRRKGEGGGRNEDRPAAKRRTVAGISPGAPSRSTTAAAAMEHRTHRPHAGDWPLVSLTPLPTSNFSSFKSVIQLICFLFLFVFQFSIFRSKWVLLFASSTPRRATWLKCAPHRCETQVLFLLLFKRRIVRRRLFVFHLVKDERKRKTNGFFRLFEPDSLCAHVHLFFKKEVLFFYRFFFLFLRPSTLNWLTDTRDTMCTWPFRLRLSFKLTRTTSVPTIEAGAQPSWSSSSSFCVLLVNCSHSPPHSATY